MKLQGKLGLPLILGLFLVAAAVMGWLYYSVSSQFSRLAQSNNGQLKEFQIQAAEKLFGATNAVLHKKIKMGNKRGLETILHKQHVEGVEEVSVFNQVGRAVYSSKDSFLDRELDQNTLKSLIAKREKFTLWTPQGVEIFDPQIITRKCTMCHVHAAWRGKEGGIGGVTYFRASTEAFRQFKGHNQAAISSMKGSVSVIIVVSLSVILLVSTLLIIYLVRKLVRKPLNDTVDMLKNIAEGEGDLTSRLEVKSADEIGLLSKWFNTFVGKVQNMIIDIANNAASLSKTSSNLSDYSGHMKSGTDVMTGKSNHVANAAEKMNSQMDNMASSMDEAATRVDTIAAAIEQITTTIHGISENTEKAKSIAGEAVSKNKSAANQISELGQAAREIGHITETITDISEQTNLLALNATIEAARAGDAGKGFAVVASEIKELAKQTADATESISQMIEGVQGTTTHTVDEIAAVSKIIASVDEIVCSIATSVKEQSQGMTEITNTLAQTTQVIQDLNKNARTSAAFSGEIADDISEVDKAAGEILTSSSHLNNSAADMSKLAARLNEMVDNFKI